mmetsp:Transcript_21598/g.40948  ORF Transcript_21598/g.40948 Transcript_21598/m.40948 type:complete len:421 (+) Transcript_21598:147-1409(+)
MGKSKKRKSGNHPTANQNNEPPKKLKQRTTAASTKVTPKSPPPTTKKPQNDKTPSKAKLTSPTSSTSNPLETRQQTFLNSLPSTIRQHFFSPDTRTVTPAQRATIWENQADLGERLVDRYAWATPDDRALKVFRHFGPIVEVGCGANAYWARWMNREGGVDVLALDVSLDVGGKIGMSSAEDGSVKDGNYDDGEKNKENDMRKNDKMKKMMMAKNQGGKPKSNGLEIRRGEPEMLSSDPEIRDSGRTLFLCYPDEEDRQPPPKEDDDDDDDDDDEGLQPPTSMAAACLEHFAGDTIIHVGELYGDTLSLDQAPWGRSSSKEFQERLAAEYHCILKMKLKNNWLHVRDTLSVWKRSEMCCLVFGGDDDDKGGKAGSDASSSSGSGVEEAYYKYIPPEEKLPENMAAPCVAHLFGPKSNDKK